MTFIPDTRTGSSESTTFEIRYDTEMEIAVNSNGIPKYLFFPQTPWLVEKTTYKVLGTIQDWEDFYTAKAANNLAYANNPTGTYTESASTGSKYILNNEEVIEGTYTVADYSTGTTAPPAKFRIIEVNSGQLDIGGYFPTAGAHPNKVYLSANNSGYTARRTYTGTTSDKFIGDTDTIAGITGIISNITLDNPRFFGNQLYYDITEDLFESTAVVYNL